ncbi:Myb-like DNA-binding domain containing protein [Trichomonas vaginalis G3]|uniref:Myb-like DNA-binding domain containing protein n=1 Tax=Trichomonas vaginalis (strain ATCC PRA-98 / G3) TaxID=412133 RepID=A2E556_TRIV3|nr:glycolytic process regulation protein [Trichomonas vaginalis G3]EAY12264.1 Myb-like DNA-binding domain containing protein [Trichomonas vaginalis G3]KAI5535939.1 glycolytic process regulation protein [Trichomonas vaginalis G3]|eukprot:XP_001324487.1 Myb-like DNA-binding domain containing protein [Trichomonas vaginalis G3]
MSTPPREDLNNFLVPHSTSVSPKAVGTTINLPKQSSPWLTVPPSTDAHTPSVIKHGNPMPVRSISTLSFHDTKDAISSAAPFPSIPSKLEVQTAKNETDAEINQLKAELASLQYERKSFDHIAQALTPNTNTHGIHEYRGLIMLDTTIQSIMQDNQRKAKEAQNNALVASTHNLTDTKHMLPMYRHIVDYPQFKSTIETNSDLLVPMIGIRYGETLTLREKEDELTQKYKELDAPWQYRQKIIDEYNDRTGEKSETWPSEFNFERPNPDEASRLKWAAEDIPQILANEEKLARTYIDTNAFVSEPISQFKQYKNRLTWTEEEKTIFVEKYRQHPKDFAKIADALPEKDVKQVIEFYYLNRYHLNLKENEGAAKRRGGNKKVITEGSKKNY